ncbi:hypothetical protein HNP69_001882 [Chryseobacterium koreense]|nr:hypothetical protein [Chryseobacterium koreense]
MEVRRRRLKHAKKISKTDIQLSVFYFRTMLEITKIIIFIAKINYGRIRGCKIYQKNYHHSKV